MNRTVYIFLTALIASQATHAIDIKTDASCKKLVTVISQAQNVESCKTAWQKIAKPTAQDRAQILQQALQLAREQKSALEQELTNLGTQTKNQSKINWGGVQLIGGAYLAAGSLLVILDYFKCPYCLGSKHKYFKNLRNILFPATGFKILSKSIDDDSLGGKLCAFISIAQLILGLPIALCLFYKSYYNLKHGLNYKQLLQDKIANLDAISTYLEELQPEQIA